MRSSDTNVVTELVGIRKPCHSAVSETPIKCEIIAMPKPKWALFKKFCKRDFCDEVRDFKIPEP